MVLLPVVVVSAEGRNPKAQESCDTRRGSEPTNRTESNLEPSEPCIPRQHTEVFATKQRSPGKNNRKVLVRITLYLAP
ncbi:unnamed protein product [Boreogadus saida]